MRSGRCSISLWQKRQGEEKKSKNHLRSPQKDSRKTSQSWLRKKENKHKAFGILTQSEWKRWNTPSAANPESLHRNWLLLAAVPPLEWRRPGMTHSKDPNPPGAFLLFPPRHQSWTTTIILVATSQSTHMHLARHFPKKDSSPQNREDATHAWRGCRPCRTACAPFHDRSFHGKRRR